MAGTKKGRKRNVNSKQTSTSKKKKTIKPPKEQLLDILSMLKGSPGTFAIDGVLEGSPLPGLSIEGVGTIPLPLCESTAKEIIEVASKAPFGLGEKTVVDESVRKCFQIEPSKISIKNPVFHSVLNNLVLKVKDQLGCGNNKISANLYKLLLYEEGGHFKPHTDSEKEDGMFATLILQLPSIFKGSHLIVHHNDCKKEVEFDRNESEYELVYAAHYTDCAHEVTLLKSGYRLALVYNLVWESPFAPPSVNQQEQLSKDIADLFSQMELENDCIGFTLDHKYTENALKNGIAALKGKDREMALYLQEANKFWEAQKKFKFYIVKLEHETIEAGEHEEYGYGFYGKFQSIEIVDEYTNVVKAYDFEGVSVPVDNMSFDVEDDLIDFEAKYKSNKKVFWGKHNKEEVDGPTGNEGSTRSRWYSHYVMVGFRED